MTLDKLDFKAAYSSSRGDNLLEDFYIPVLSNSISYKRIAGYFSSNSLAIAARGISKFIIENDGYMKLICNVYLSESDKKVIESYLQKIEDDFLIDLQNMTDELQKNHLKCLGWMLKNNKLDIKIAVIPDNTGIQHEKIGIFEDEQGNIVSFSGSDNETWKGWVANTEKFHVFCSWKEREKEHLISDVSDFDAYWNNDVYRALVYKLEEAIKKGLIEIAPYSNEEFKILTKYLIDNLINKYKELNHIFSTQKEWPHKQIALEKFMEKKNGIIEMATGTGKTSLAINIMNKLLDENKIDGAIISTYGNDLLDQWYSQLVEKSNEYLIIYKYYGENKELSDYLINHRDSILLINWSNIRKFIENNEVIKNKILIIDEVHGFGSKSIRENLTGKINGIEYRLGLSATSERNYDDEGNDFIKNEIGDIIFKYNVYNAIEDGILCEFNYVPLRYDLSEEDRDKLRKAYNKYYAKIKANKNEFESRRALYIDLANVRKTSKNKLPIFEEYIKKHPEVLNKTIIFVETMDYGKLIQDIIIKINSSFHTYYADDDKNNLIKFAEGELDLLITCKKISQGIDIKSIKNIILFSSSRGKLETIQRMGRCLRVDPTDLGKVSNVIDFITNKRDDADEEYDDPDEFREKWMTEISKIRRIYK